VREGVRRLLETQPDLQILATCSDLDALMAAVETEHPDVVVTDIRMPPSRSDEGIRAAALLRETHPEIGVVVLSQYAEPAYALVLLEGGSARRAYLLKERVDDVQQLAGAIRAVVGGGSVIDPEVVAQLVGRRLSNGPLDDLTEREREVLVLMAEGRSNQAICDRLFLAPKTVEAHIANIFSTLELLPAPNDHRRVLALLAHLRA
jgi:DNA-binding NarL/FixJ family response regulator